MYKQPRFEKVAFAILVILTLVLFLINYLFKCKLNDSTYYNNIFSILVEIIVGGFSALLIIFFQRIYSSIQFKKDFDISGKYHKKNFRGQLELDKNKQPLIVEITYNKEDNNFDMKSEYLWEDIKICNSKIYMNTDLPGLGIGYYQYEDENDFGEYKIQVDVKNKNIIHVIYKNISELKEHQGKYDLIKQKSFSN